MAVLGSLALPLFANAQNGPPDLTPQQPFGTNDVPILTGPPRECPITGKRQENWEASHRLAHRGTQNLSVDYNTGQWRELQETLKMLLTLCGIPLLDGSSASVLFKNNGQPSLQPTPSLSRIVFRDNPEPPPYTSRLVGKRLYDVHLLIAPFDAVPVSSYSAKPTTNPILAALPKLVSQFAGVYLKAVAPPQPVTGFQPTIEREPNVRLVVYELSTGALTRADVTIRDATPEQGTAKALSLTTTYSWSPLQHLAFGIGTAAIIDESLNSPAKVDGGVLIADSARTDVLTFLALDYHPVAYDDTYLHPTPAERFRFFIGPVLTPDVGLCAGIGYGVIRGIAIQAGYGVLLANVLRKEDRLGSPPQDPGHPTRRGALGVFFAGVELSP